MYSDPFYSDLQPANDSLISDKTSRTKSEIIIEAGSLGFDEYNAQEVDEDKPHDL